jgi:Tol biopolymer transport system component
MKHLEKKWRAFLLGLWLLMGCTSAAVPAPAPTMVPRTTVVTRTKPIDTPGPHRTPAAPEAAATPVAVVATVVGSEAQPTQPTFVQLTNGGCCVQPFFSADGARVLFLDKPVAEATTGIYAVPLDAPQRVPTLFTERLGPFSRNLDYAIDLVDKQTVVERLSDGQRFGINNGGRPVSIAPDASRVVWTMSEEAGNFDVRRSDIWVANIDGTNAQRVASRYGGGVVAWFSDGKRMLISGRASRGEPAPTLAILNLETGDIQSLFTAERMRGFVLSPNDKHVVFFVAQAQDETLNGMYVLHLDVPDAPPNRLDLFGAYKWRTGDHLLFVPLKMGAPSHELWQMDMNTGSSELLIPAAPDSPFKIANGDWDVARDGKRVVFVSARDRNIWLLQLAQ